jgi:hypothetical protein
MQLAVGLWRTESPRPSTGDDRGRSVRPANTARRAGPDEELAGNP